MRFCRFWMIFLFTMVYDYGLWLLVDRLIVVGLLLKLIIL